jgi:hypothetical protein
MQLDKVVAPAGVFSPARTYSLVRSDDGLYLIYTGRAMGYVPSTGDVSGRVAGAILDRMADKRALEIDENERKLRASSPAEMVRTKHSLFVPKHSIQEVVFRSGALYNAFPVVVVKASKKLKLHFHHQDQATVRQFFEQLLSKK